ncbi:amino acid ABC transporter permease [Streptomyces qinzhouensis]|uniref:Amino acid ABC transporter permease n=1 Tax=Streptomyces qinzhouensis TaxID=2599401 RepID=A0A5B8JIH9_9ACTN|nr:amino acid ABC transporter permease [Streptomyces qinzhouensis]QDY79671.1 amino acid ABC transporter permease [Streptomyces qinzhouensis]
MTTAAPAPAAEQAGPVPAPVRVPVPTVLAPVALVVAGTAVVLAVRTATVLWQASPDSGAWSYGLKAVAALGALAALAVLKPVAEALRHSARARAATEPGRIAEARAEAADARESARVALGGSLAVVVLTVLTVFLLANDQAVQATFFDPDAISSSFGDVTAAFGTNVFIAVAAEAFVLVWGLVLAVAKLAPGRAGRPLRRLATAYIDIFRAVPSIVIIYLIGFGLPLAQIPGLSSLSPTWAAILALTLTYGAYVAEVYRSGIDSIHWSQTAAARSLGLSHARTLRHVVVPQAVRRVTPPLLNDFIGLQKDTALVTVIGTIDAFNQAKIYASNEFNLSSVTVVAALFVVITIPQTRFADRLLARGGAGKDS